MKVSFNWLRELVEIVLTPVELADRLTMAGLEVEGVEEIRPAFTQVVVGRIEAIDPPPRGERVSLCRVDVGTAVVPILCGAPNTLIIKLAGGISDNDDVGLVHFGLFLSVLKHFSLVAIIQDLTVHLLNQFCQWCQCRFTRVSCNT